MATFYYAENLEANIRFSKQANSVSLDRIYYRLPNDTFVESAVPALYSSEEKLLKAIKRNCSKPVIRVDANGRTMYDSNGKQMFNYYKFKDLMNLLKIKTVDVD